MNWFKRHLNWTFFIAWLVGIALYLAFILSITSLEGLELFILSYSLFIIWLLLVGGWFLRQKGRSLWFLLLLPFLREIGVIIFLCLENKSGVKPSEKIAQDNLRKASWLQPKS
jgi:hypothetical protein